MAGLPFENLAISAFANELEEIIRRDLPSYALGLSTKGSFYIFGFLDLFDSAQSRRCEARASSSGVQRIPCSHLDCMN